MNCETINCNVANGEPCRGCKGMPFQCNHCRANHPNAATTTRSSIVRMMRETGVTAAEAEAAHGVRAGRAI